ncbi:MAG TPA: hypothetical protein VHV32_19370 [Candidatus Angelobacter sp.]|jgi:hypothetical protein|nr:hypothetical protein [Candidatus Angelobacter sp.]
MAAQVQITNVDASTQSIYVTFNVVLSGSYPTGGDLLNFATATADPQFVGLLAAVESSSLINIDVWSMGGGTIGASNLVSYDPVVTKSGTPATINPASGIKLKVSALSATTEHAAGAYESQYTGDIITGMAVFTKLI